MKTQLLHGDCLTEMKKIPSNSVDLVLTDPPYGTTACSWDTVVPFDEMWFQLKRVAKKNAPIILFSAQPFTSHLIMSNRKNFRYCWYWKKTQHSNPLLAKTQPLRVMEDIVVFYEARPQYHPETTPVQISCTKNNRSQLWHGSCRPYVQRATGYPKNILEFPRERGLHPTQKPVPLLEYLIKIYTHPNEVVLDFTMGSGSTGVACKRTNRSFIGIELQSRYFLAAKERITSA